jgi:hypothetical protein
MPLRPKRPPAELYGLSVRQRNVLATLPPFPRSPTRLRQRVPAAVTGRCAGAVQQTLHIRITGAFCNARRASLGGRGLCREDARPKRPTVHCGRSVHGSVHERLGGVKRSSQCSRLGRPRVECAIQVFGVGRRLGSSTTASRCSGLCRDRSVFLGKYWRSSPLDPPMFCQDPFAVMAGLVAASIRR